MFRTLSACRAALLLLAIAVAAFAQVNTADVVGTVTDASGAALPNATVTITNAENGVSRAITTGTSGEYAFSSLQVGKYTLKVDAKGFAGFEAQDLKLAAGDRARVDAKLAVGQQTQTVEVEATAAALQTDSSAVGSLITDRAVQDLPLNGRNFVNLVQLSAGVSEGLSDAMNSGTRPDDRRQSSSYSANGQTDEVNNNLIDGMDNNERFIGTIGVRPSIDAIQEVRVQTNLYTAEVGRAAGAVVDLITKSGTNQLHGSVFEFLRNNVLDGRDFFAATRPELRQNQFGASVGGPIVKDKTFFFGDYEGFRQLRGGTATTTVPTLFEQQNPGNFSDIAGPVIPKSSFDPLGYALFQAYPKPTNSATANNFTTNPLRSQNSTTFDGKVDHHITSNQTLAGRYSFNDVTTFTPPILPQASVGGVNFYPGDNFGSGASLFSGQAKERQQNVMLSYENILRPNLLLELKAGYLRSSIHSNPINFGKSVANALGVPCNAVSCINVPGNDVATGLPLIFMPNGYGGFGDAGYIPLATIDNTFMYMGAIDWTKGTHSVKLGAGLNRRQFASGQSSYPRGQYVLVASLQNTLADLIQGEMSTASRGNTLNFPGYRSWEPSFYAQDDWHARRWLTLNLGLRYDIYTPLTEEHGQFANFDPATGLLISPSLSGSQHSNATVGINTDYSNLAPRIGFAITAPHSFVVRGGFGMTFWPGNYASGAAMKNAPYTFLFGCGVAPYSGTPCPAAYAAANGDPLLSAGLPIPVVNPALATNPANYLGTSINATAFNFRSSYLEQYTLQLQKEYRGNVMTAGYVGNLGRHLVVQPNINQPATNTSPYPFPSLPGTSIGHRESVGNSRYDALQLTFQRRFSRGLAANVNYTYASTTNNASVTDESQGNSFLNCVGYCLMDNPSNPSSPTVVKGFQQYDWGNGDLDIRHRFTAMVNYELPFGKQLSGLSRQLIAGWSLNGIGVWQSGVPFTVVNNSDVSGIIGVSADRPNQTGTVTLSNPTIQEWFNTSAFVTQTKGTLGNQKRNQLFGPPQRRLDFSIFKEFAMRERYRLQFRTEVFNLTNTANFAQPASTLGGGGFGAISSTTPSATPREIQFSLKMLF
jgi:hypothetical protein